MKKYDVCLYLLNEEIGGFHIDNVSIEELMEYINDEFTNIKYDKLSIIELKNENK